MGIPYDEKRAIMKVSYTMIVKDQGDDDSKSWEERNTFTTETGCTAKQHAENVVNWFNSTLHQKEKPRELVNVKDIIETEIHDEFDEEE